VTYTFPHKISSRAIIVKNLKTRAN